MGKSQMIADLKSCHKASREQQLECFMPLLSSLSWAETRGWTTSLMVQGIVGSQPH